MTGNYKTNSGNKGFKLYISNKVPGNSIHMHDCANNNFKCQVSGNYYYKFPKQAARETETESWSA
jgi:hypothetical protein